MKDRRWIVWVSVFIIIFLFTKVSYAQQEVLHLNIYGPGKRQLNLFVASPLFLQGASKEGVSPPPLVKDLVMALKNNFSFLPFINLIKQKEIVGGAGIKGVRVSQVDLQRFRLSKVDLLLTLGWDVLPNGKLRIELRMIDVFSATLFVGRGYLINRAEHVYLAANRFCADFMKKLTGKKGFFSSMLVFVKRTGNGNKNLFIVTPQGYLLKQITKIDGLCLSPSWSWDSKRIVFTLLSRDTHALLLWNREDGSIKRIFVPGNTIISPVFTPGGNIVVSLDIAGNPDIFLLDKHFKIKKTLVKSWAIDISPSFDKSGTKMVFVSSRLGNPNIFLLDLKTNSIKRLSYMGTYNTSPNISPDGRYVVYSTMTPAGHRIVLCDTRTLKEKIISSGPGSDETPVWGPDGYFIAFCSSRTGAYKIYITTRYGDRAHMVNTGKGDATSVAWSKLF